MESSSSSSFYNYQTNHHHHHHHHHHQHQQHWKHIFLGIVTAAVVVMWRTPPPAAVLAFTTTIARRHHPAQQQLLLKRQTIMSSSSSTATTTMMEPDWEVAKQIVGFDNNNDDHRSNKVCLAIAGGGSSCISTLASTNGASSLLLEGIVTYDRVSIVRYLSKCDGPFFHSTTSTTTSSCLPKNFVSSETSIALSMAAWHSSHALCSSPTSSNSYSYWGIGCTSALVSNNSSSNKKERSHSLGYVTITDPQQFSHTYQMKVCNTIPRFQQDIVLGNTLLKLFLHQLEQQQKQQQEPPSSSIITGSSSSSDEVVQVEYIMKSANNTTTTTTANDNNNDVLLENAMNQVATSQRPYLYLSLDTTNQQQQQQWKATSLPQDLIHPIIIPGSFNPIHEGHVALAQAAATATTTNNNVSVAEDTIWNKAVSGKKHSHIIWEISMTNADKAPITPKDVLSRLKHIQEMATKQQQQQQQQNMTFGVWLTDAPLFIQKVQLLHNSLVCCDDKQHIKNFVIGTDTMVRLLDPKYYHNSLEEMISVLQEFQSKQIRFIVGGRLDQKKSSSDETESFVTGQEELQQLPSSLQSLFYLLPDFRVDISSSEIRAKQQQQQQQ